MRAWLAVGQRRRRADSDDGLRFFGRSRIVTGARPLAVAGSLLARAGVLQAVAVWPSRRGPNVALDLRDETSEAWIGPLLPAHVRTAGLDPRTWQAVRARALVIPRGRSPLIAAAEQGVGRELIDPRVSLYSSSGCLRKLTFFIAEAHASAPTVVVKAMGRRGDGRWLRAEMDKLQAVRSRLSPQLRAALPRPPLLAGELGGEYLVVEAYGHFDGWCDRSGHARARAHAWLAELQRFTASPGTWRASDTARAAGLVTAAWGMLRPNSAARVAVATRRMLHQLDGTPMRSCLVHGDFTPGNLASAAGEVKVLDWEWCRSEGPPWFDLWGYELADLHLGVSQDRVYQLDAPVDGALRRVEAELKQGGIDPAFALPAAAVVLAELVLRARRTLGRAPAWEIAAGRLMAALEHLLAWPRPLSGRSSQANGTIAPARALT